MGNDRNGLRNQLTSALSQAQPIQSSPARPSSKQVTHLPTLPRPLLHMLHKSISHLPRIIDQHIGPNVPHDAHFLQHIQNILLARGWLDGVYALRLEPPEIKLVVEDFGDELEIQTESRQVEVLRFQDLVRILQPVLSGVLPRRAGVHCAQVAVGFVVDEEPLRWGYGDVELVRERGCWFVGCGCSGLHWNCKWFNSVKTAWGIDTMEFMDLF
ncbi:hypothetical protein BDW74DRAFT_116402 [Aspergillus multicolor]|uniref:uncharacterized protein n=1 Tax=Aspergillus multicolor TaxID=41759 RepID=UPI003CCD5283